MLEIIALWTLAKRVGQIVEEKGRKSGWYKVLTVVLWFGGEFMGAIIGSLIVGIDESTQCLVYIFALIGAAIGAGIAYWIAKNVSPVASESQAPLLQGEKQEEKIAEEIIEEAEVEKPENPL